MAKMSVRKHIAAPVQEVFDKASDFPAAADRISGITRMEMLSDGPVGLGTRFRETRVMFGREATEEMEVTRFEPPHVYGLSAESHGSRYYSELHFTPEGSGTDVEMTFEATPMSMVAKVMSVLMRPMMKSVAKLCLCDLSDLKASIEGAPSPSTRS